MSANSETIYVAVVDDDEGLCRSLSRLLRAADIHPVSYLSAEDFLADAKRPRFDCVVLDIQLGGMSGIELHRRLRSVRDVTPVIYISTHDDPTAHEEALAAGCVAFLKKTDPGSEVLEAVGRAIGKQKKIPNG